MNEFILEVCKINGYEKALRLLRGKPSSYMQKCRLESFRKFKKKMAGNKRSLSFDINIDEEVKVYSMKDEVPIKESSKKVLTYKKIKKLESLSFKLC